MRRAAVLGPSLLAVWALALVACSPDAPKGVDKTRLDDAIGDAIGDPNTCVLIGEAGSGKTVYRYNTHVACGRTLPSCQGAGAETIDGLLKAVAKDGQVRTLSCNSLADGSRGVGWAAGPIAGKPYVYAAMMEGTRAFPGRMMAERLADAFKDVGL